MRFEPSGFSKNPQIPYAKSIVDYLFRWLASKFLDEQSKQEVGVVAPAAALSDGPASRIDNAPRLALAPAANQSSGDAATRAASLRAAFINQADAPPCSECGCLMVRNGTCYKCMNCGSTSGCS
jgi:ribonucleoside-diphosphate reductase alpha chain